MKKTLLLLSLCCSMMNVNAQQKDKAYIVSNAHFDTQWNWDVQRSIREFIPKTMESNLYLLERYPNYIFNFEGGIKYAWMKEYYPLEYEAVKRYIKLGRWHVTGSTWDANDFNIGAPETQTRNILYGQDFYQKEFGVKGTDIFLPDCFGFSYVLPSISAHSGLIGFSTQKLQWRNNPFYGNSKIPFEFGLWEGIDGARIMLIADAHNYTTKWPDTDLSQYPNLVKIVKNNPLHMSYHYYGTGDTGGSPTVESVRAVEKGVNGKGDIQIISATSDQMFKDFLPYENHPELPVYKGELLMDVHGTGCYTSQAAMKWYNRRNELLGAAAERAAVMADWSGAQTYPLENINAAYKRFIWHQFHDDLTGTSIPRAYEFSWNDELLSLNQFKNTLLSAAGAFSKSLDTQVKGIPVILYNVNSFVAEDLVTICVETPKPTTAISVFDAQGKPVPSQLLKSEGKKATVLISAKVPAVGYTVYDIRTSGSKAAAGVKVTGNSLENSIYKVELDTNGDIAQITDKRNGKQLVENGKSIRLAMFTDNPSYEWPAWEIMKTTLDKTPVALTGAKISIAEQGALRGALCVERTYGDSKIKQIISLNEGTQNDRIDIQNIIDWEATNSLLKAEFPLAVSNPEAAYDLGLGHVMRGNNTPQAYEVYSHFWTDLTDKSGNYGVSVLNNGKYGWDKPADNLIRLSLLHTPSTRGGYKYQAQQDHGHHEFTYSIVGHTGSLQQVNTPQKAELLNQPIQAFVAPKHKGALGREFSMVKVDNPAVIMKALKRAENEDALILRFYETTGKQAQQVNLTLASEIASAVEVNGIEETLRNVSYNGKGINFQIKPFGIVSLKVKLQKNNTQANLKNQEITLPYNIRSASQNGFRRVVNFDGKGHAYAAEMLPSEVDYKGVRFHLGDPDSVNAVKCRGQEIQLPEGNYNKVYLLAAATARDMMGDFTVGTKTQEKPVPYYTGFYGQWGHKGHTEGFVKPADVAFVCTHLHDMAQNKDMYYEFGYLYAICLDVPEKAQTLTLPENSQIVVFAATAVKDDVNVLTPATDLTQTHVPEAEIVQGEAVRKNYVVDKKVIEKSGEINHSERAENALDEDTETKWCDVGPAKEKFIAIDMEKEKEIHGWSCFHAGMESLDYITKEYSLQVKNNLNDAWKTVDTVYDNTALETDRLLKAPVKARYVRLWVTKPDQSEGGTVRLYEFQVY